ncbi:rRNA maturation RNase YbeY [Bacteroidota bacterium]
MQTNLHVTSAIKNLDKAKVHKLVGLLKHELGISIESLLINIISSKEIIRINKQYLDHNYTTDILTFNYSGSNSDIDGEIFISVDDAAYFARKYKVSLSSELTRLIIHGILHLAGYDDTKDDDKKKMKSIENNLTIEYNFPLLR